MLWNPLISSNIIIQTYIPLASPGTNEPKIAESIINDANNYTLRIVSTGVNESDRVGRVRHYLFAVRLSQWSVSHKVPNSR